MGILDIKIPGTSFLAAELVPVELYTMRGPIEFSRFCSLQLAHFAQGIKDHFGGKAMTINNKCWGGDRNYSGFRYPGCGKYVETGAHFRNCAIDFKIKGLSDLEVRQELVLNYKELGITIIEDGMDGWSHAAFEWFARHENDLAVFDMVKGGLTFLNDWEASKYKVRAS